MDSLFASHNYPPLLTALFPTYVATRRFGLTWVKGRAIGLGDTTRGGEMAASMGATPSFAALLRNRALRVVAGLAQATAGSCVAADR